MHVGQIGGLEYVERVPAFVQHYVHVPGRSDGIHEDKWAPGSPEVFRVAARCLALTIV